MVLAGSTPAPQTKNLYKSVVNGNGCSRADATEYSQVETIRRVSI